MKYFIRMYRAGRSTVMVPKHSVPSSNKLLARLPAADYQRLLPDLQNIPLSFKQILHRGGEEVQRIYFPERGVCSITHVMADGRMAGTATVGSEGFIGIAAYFGRGLDAGDAIVQVPNGAAQVMDLALFRREMDRRGVFCDLINRYAGAYMVSLTQFVACNALHSVEERLARWLLTFHDRVGQDDLPLMQEFLALTRGSSPLGHARHWRVESCRVDRPRQQEDWHQESPKPRSRLV